MNTDFSFIEIDLWTVLFLFLDVKLYYYLSDDAR